jgi:hypothetical protein
MNINGKLNKKRYGLYDDTPPYNNKFYGLTNTDKINNLYQIINDTGEYLVSIGNPKDGSFSFKKYLNF